MNAIFYGHLLLSLVTSCHFAEECVVYSYPQIKAWDPLGLPVSQGSEAAKC